MAVGLAHFEMSVKTYDPPMDRQIAMGMLLTF